MDLGCLLTSPRNLMDMPFSDSVPPAIWWSIAIVAGLIFFAVVIGIRWIPNNCVGIIEKRFSQGIRARGADHGAQRRGRIPDRPPPRRRPSLLLADPISHSSRAARHDFAGKDRVRLCATASRCFPVRRWGTWSSATIFRTHKFLGHGGDDASIGQRGRQRAIIREGVYAINLGLFVVVTQDSVYRLDMQGRQELATLVGWQKELNDIRGFDPVVIGEEVSAEDPLISGKQIVVDSIGIVTIQDGPSLAPGEIIAPAVGNDISDANYHNNYQDPEAFLRAGGRRGRQYVPLTDGTYFINRWFATIEIVPKSVVPIGFVGVVVSYYGPMGADVSGESFRHGERVARGERGSGKVAGTWEISLQPLRGQADSRADDQLRAALDHRQERGASLR